MSEQETAAASAEPTDSSIPETGTTVETAQPPVDWEARAKEHQSWGTRLAQEKAELAARVRILDAWQSDDPQAQQWAAQQLGIQLQEEEQAAADPMGADPQIATLMARLEALEGRTQADQQAQQEAENYQTFRQWTDPQLTQMGIPAQLHDVIADTAAALPFIHTPQGEVPDLKTAWERFGGMAPAFAEIPAVQNLVKQSWAQTKKAPYMTQAGGDAHQQPPNLDEMSRSEQAEWMAERLHQLEG